MKQKDLLNGLSLSVKKISGENAEFFSKNGFIALKVEEKLYHRVFLHRMFPFELPWEYISVSDEEQAEIGIIYSVDDFPEDTRLLIKNELLKKYYSPIIKSIKSVKERYGFSYWSVITDDDRTVEFTIQDTFRNTVKVGDNKVILLDVDGNRFVIEDVLALDRKSYKEIELYL